MTILMDVGTPWGIILGLGYKRQGADLRWISLMNFLHLLDDLAKA